MTRSEKVKSIVNAIMTMTKEGLDFNILEGQVEVLRPYTFIKIKGREVNGRGFSKCSAPDEWDALKGMKIAAKRAARDYVDNIDKWENLTDGE